MASVETFVEAAQLSERLRSANPPVLIDTRPTAEYEKSRIAGALSAPELLTKMLQDSSEATLKAYREHFYQLLGALGLTGTESLVVYEESMGTAKGASCRGAFLLRHLGFPSVGVLQGGLKAWRSLNLPLDSQPPKQHSVPAPVDLAARMKPDTRFLATVDEVAKVAGSAEARLLDDRDLAEWLGTASAPPGAPECPRKGRIPGARWVAWTRLLTTDADGVERIRGGDEVRRLCGEAGFNDTKAPIILYCYKGARASNTFLAMEAAGYENVRVFLGSWNEWSRDPNRPIDDRVLQDTTA